MTSKIDMAAIARQSDGIFSAARPQAIANMKPPTIRVKPKPHHMPIGRGANQVGSPLLPHCIGTFIDLILRPKCTEHVAAKTRASINRTAVEMRRWDFQRSSTRLTSLPPALLRLFRQQALQLFRVMYIELEAAGHHDIAGLLARVAVAQPF